MGREERYAAGPSTREDLPPPVVAAHQVDHLPWLGYFARMQRVDVFIELDCVQYNHHRFQNRNRIVDCSGRTLWLRVPVLGGGRHLQSMSDIRIAPGDWRRRYLETVRHAYSRHPHFRSLFEELRDVIDRPWERLVDLNRALRDLLRERLGIATPMPHQGELGLGSARREELLLGAVAAVSGRSFLSGPTGREFLDRRCFAARGVPLGFDPPFEARPYPQVGQESLVADLSTLDLLMNLGPDAGDWLRVNQG